MTEKKFTSAESDLETEKRSKYIYIYIYKMCPTIDFITFFWKVRGQLFRICKFLPQVTRNPQIVWGSQKLIHLWCRKLCCENRKKLFGFFRNENWKIGSRKHASSSLTFSSSALPEYLARTNSPPGIRWRKKHCESGPVFDLTKNYKFVSRESRSRDDIPWSQGIWCELRWFSGTKFQS